MNIRVTGLLPIFGFIALGACQTTPTPHSGNLSSYEGVAPPGKSLRAAVHVRRDDEASDAVERVFLQPAIMAQGVGLNLSDADRAAVLSEVDRQICFEVSERFTIAPYADEQAAIVRTWVVRVDPTGRVGSGVSAVAGFFNPVPVISVRAPGSTGGLAVESEMLAPGRGGQIAAMTWSRNATVLGMDSPSLSRVGDALQFAEPMGDAVGDAFSSENREVRDIPDPDPCAQHGSRSEPIGRRALGVVSGLYVPREEPSGSPD